MICGERDLQKLIRGMAPELDPRRYAFISVPSGAYPELEPLMRLRGDEGDPLLLRIDDARSHGLVAGLIVRRIILGVHSDLEAVGFTAAISACLTEHGISSNIVAGFYHNHVLVLEAEADRGFEALKELSSNGLAA